MSFSVTILGNSSAMPAKGRHHSAHALNVHEQFYLIDCGEGTQSRLFKYGINPLKINAVFISHLHGDHVYGLFPLISTMGLMGRKRPLLLFAPAPMAEIMEMNSRYFDDRHVFDIEYHQVDTGANTMIWENKSLEVWTIPLRHRIPSAGYLFREKEPRLNIRKDALQKYSPGIAAMNSIKNGNDFTLDDGTVIPNDQITYLPYSPRTYAYCSDTLYSGKVGSIVKGCDLLYHEATFAAEDSSLAKKTGHTTTVQAAKLAAGAGVSELIIGHFSGRYKEIEPLVHQAREIFPRTSAAAEGCTFVVTKNRDAQGLAIIDQVTGRK